MSDFYGSHCHDSFNHLAHAVLTSCKAIASTELLSSLCVLQLFSLCYYIRKTHLYLIPASHDNV